LRPNLLSEKKAHFLLNIKSLERMPLVKNKNEPAPPAKRREAHSRKKSPACGREKQAGAPGFEPR
jgi:hypothetical protein